MDQIDFPDEFFEDIFKCNDPQRCDHWIQDLWEIIDALLGQNSVGKSDLFF